MTQPRFHLAFLVTDLEATREFYRDVLGCTQGREADRWIDFDFFGHQISARSLESLPPSDGVARLVLLRVLPVLDGDLLGKNVGPSRDGQVRSL